VSDRLAVVKDRYRAYEYRVRRVEVYFGWDIT
jgi:hypothetical protein